MGSKFDATGASIPTATLAVRGGVAAVLSLVVNGVLLGIVLTVDLVATFDALSIPPVAGLTVLGVVGASVVYGFLTGRVDDPDRTFIIVAAVVLVLSFVPTGSLLAFDDDAVVGGVVVLMIMHVVVAAVCVWALTDRYSPIAR